MRVANDVFFLMNGGPPRSTLFPYTTLFRSPGAHPRPRLLRQRRGRGHDADRLERPPHLPDPAGGRRRRRPPAAGPEPRRPGQRSEEHTSELQSRQYLVCRLLLEKKKTYLTICAHYETYYNFSLILYILAYIFLDMQDFLSCFSNVTSFS